MPPEEFDRLREREDFMAAMDEGGNDAIKKRVYQTSGVETALDKKFGK
jgi:hypothetical protein